MKYTRPTDGLDKDARLHIEGAPYKGIRPDCNNPDARPPALVIIESPYAGNVEQNTAYARSCLLDSLQRGEAPIVSHLLHTQVLDDRNKFERKWGIEAGLAWYAVAGICAVYTDYGISDGMKAGIARAELHGVRVEYRRLDAGEVAA